MSECEGHSGGGVSLGNGHLLGLADLLATVGTEALPFQHRGTGTMETVRDVDVWLALHEGPLDNKKQHISYSVHTRGPITGGSQDKAMASEHKSCIQMIPFLQCWKLLS